MDARRERERSVATMALVGRWFWVMGFAELRELDSQQSLALAQLLCSVLLPRPLSPLVFNFTQFPFHQER